MKIIQGFNAITNRGWEFSYLTKMYHPILGWMLIANDKNNNGEALSPVLKVSALNKYLALNIFPYNKGLTASLYSPEDESYMVYEVETESWAISQEPVYYSDSFLTEYIQHWYKSFQLKIDVPRNSYLDEVKVGIDVLISYQEYILNFALIQHLTHAVHFGYFAYPLSDGVTAQIEFPEQFDQNITNLSIRKRGEKVFYGSPTLNNGIITFPLAELTDEPAIVNFDYTPQVRYVKFGEYQIESLPSIIIRKKGESNLRGGYYREQLAFDPSSRSPEDQLLVRTHQTYDLPLEIMFIAPTITFASMMYEQILKKVESKAVDVPATGEQVGIFWSKTIMRDGGTAIKTNPIVQTLSSVVVDCEIKNLPVTI